MAKQKCVYLYFLEVPEKRAALEMWSEESTGSTLLLAANKSQAPLFLSTFAGVSCSSISLPFFTAFAELIHVTKLSSPA